MSAYRRRAADPRSGRPSRAPGRWRRWSSPVMTRNGALEQAWMASLQQQGTESTQLKLLDGVPGWQVYFFRGQGVEVDAGVHALSPIIDTAASCFTCRPHSFSDSSSHHQRPARKGSPTAMARVQGAQFAKAREQALRPEQRHHPQPQAQQLQVLRLRLHRCCQRFEMRRDVIVEGAALVGQLHHLSGPAEQLAAGKFLKVGDAA